MTREEAAAVLGTGPDPGIGDVRKVYEALHTDYQIRLTNAPTPALKKTYQQKLQEIAEACELLAPGALTGQYGGDLPSPEPVLHGQEAASAPKRPTAYSRPANRSEAASGVQAETTAGLPRSTLVAGVIAVVLLATLSFVAVRWYQVATRTAALEAEHATLALAAAALEGRVTAQEGLLYGDRLRIRNLSRDPARILAVALIYRDASGSLKLAHSGNYDYPTWDIRPGDVAQLDAKMQRGRAWDGPVLYYALLIDYTSVESFLKAGVWAQDVDRRDNVVTLDLD